MNNSRQNLPEDNIGKLSLSATTLQEATIKCTLDCETDGMSMLERFMRIIVNKNNNS